MPLVTGFHHVSIIVADLERSLVFYRDLLGLKIDESRPDLSYPGCWLVLGQYQIHLMQLKNPYAGASLPTHGGRDRHFAMTTDSIRVIADSLSSSGIRYTESKSGRKALFCPDPDGNVLEFVEISKTR